MLDYTYRTSSLLCVFLDTLYSCDSGNGIGRNMAMVTRRRRRSGGGGGEEEEDYDY